MIFLAVSYIGNMEKPMSGESALIIYDGDCIFCQNYVQLVRLKETIGPVALVDARSGDPRVVQYQRQGFDLNEGMLFVWRGRVYHGSDAVHVLARLSSPTSWFNHLNRAIFGNRVAAVVLYPFLKFGRRVTLLLRGKGPIVQTKAD
jgi:predicted DCC family thiol-disulfide oxidoreductase YuxK